MAKKEQIKYIIPSSLSAIGYDGKKFYSLNGKEKLYTASRIKYDYIIVYSFKISKEQANNDISSIVEIKMYEEAGLDTNKNYKITYIVKELDFDEMNLVEAFAVDISLIEESFAPKIKKIKYIDFLSLPFLSFSTFYKNKILKHKNDIFIYLAEDEAFLSFYKEGSYISTKSLININEIVEKFVDQNIVLDIEKFYQILLNKGFEREIYEKDEIDILNLLEIIFSDIFTKINNIAMHNRSVFGFDKIDRIFFSTPKGRIKGLREFLEKFGFVDVEILDFNLFPDKQKENFLENVSASYCYDKFIENSNEQNVTIYPRPKPFLSTSVGKFSIIFSLFIIAILGFYGYLLSQNHKLKKEKDLLKIEYASIQKRVKKFKNIIKKNDLEISRLKDEIKKQQIYYKNIEESINRLENLKNDDKSYVNFIARIDLLLARYRLKCKSIEQFGENKMVIEVVSNYNNRDRISKFIKALIRNGFINVSTNEIKLDKNNYISKIEIENE